MHPAIYPAMHPPWRQAKGRNAAFLRRPWTQACPLRDRRAKDFGKDFGPGQQRIADRNRAHARRRRHGTSLGESAARR
jgi:hypothetical protein